MARIDHLNISISQMNKVTLYNLIHDIRENRRKRPEVKARKQTARTKRRAATKKNPTQSDVFAMVENMSDSQKARLISKLMKKGETK